MSTSYADSAQARQTDAAYQREQPRFVDRDLEDEAAFKARVKASREWEAQRARENMKRALGELEVFFGDGK